MSTPIERPKLFIAPIGVHANGYSHWSNVGSGYRTVYRRKSGDFVRYRGKMYRVYQVAPYPENRIDVPCRCAGGERKEP